MCGIAGVFTVERPVGADLVAAVLRMLDRQVRRGPDDWGILIPEAAARDGEVRALLEPHGWEHVRTYPGSAEAPAAVLGTRRLAILDLSPAARMPMGSPDGRVWVTYNGEVYNFRELRAELAARGHAFRSEGDTETLVHGYREWGPEVVHRLRGMFAFAVLDARAPDGPRLFLAKDRFGIKPLYWGRHRCVFQFASEVRALMAGGLMLDEPEPRGFHGFLVYGSVPTPWTTVRDVLSLPAAHTLAIDEVSYSYPTPRRYWTLPESGSLTISREEAVAETRRLLDESVRMHLASDVPLGVFLSGGMDSTALVALASGHVTTPLVTLCVSFDEATFSESEQAAVTAQRYGTKHIEVRVRWQDFIAEIDRIFDAMDQPTIDGVNIYFVAKAAREAGLTVALSGVGGNKLFRGYLGFTRAPRVARLARLPGVRLAAALASRVGPALSVPRLAKLEFLREHPVLGPYLFVRGLFTPAQAARLLDAGRLPLWVGAPVEGALTPDLYARLEVACYLQNQILRDTDVFGMAHSLEVRVPFLDHRLAELAFGLPDSSLASGPGSEPLFAAALGGELAEAVARRPKTGFGLPFERWMKDAWGEVVRESDAMEPIAPEAANGLAADFRAGRTRWSQPWGAAVLRGLGRRRTVPRWAPVEGPGTVLCLLPQVYGAQGGIPRYNQALLRGLGEAFPRTRLVVVSVNDAGMPAGVPAEGRVELVGAGPRGRPFHKLRFVATALAAARSSRPELLICGHINLMPLAWALGRLSGCRTALVAHGIEAWAPWRLRRWATRRADRVLPVSRFTAERMIAWGLRPEAVRVLPDTVDGEVFRVMTRPRRPQRPTLLTVARLATSERHKGVDRVLAALPEVREYHPAVRYVVCGQGDDRPRLEALARDLSVAEHVEFRGFVPERDLPAAYNEADLFVMPSVKEGFGIVFLEALACGVPVIAGNRDGSVDAVLDGKLGRLVDPTNRAALVEACAGPSTSGTIKSGDRHRMRQAILSAYGVDRFRERVGAALGG